MESEDGPSVPAVPKLQIRRKAVGSGVGTVSSELGGGSRAFLTPATIQFDAQDPDNQKWDHIAKIPMTWGMNPDYNYAADNAHRIWVWRQTNARIDQRNHDIDVRREMAEGSRLVNVDLEAFAQDSVQAPFTPAMAETGLHDALYEQCLIWLREAYRGTRDKAGKAGKADAMHAAVQGVVAEVNRMLHEVGVKARFQFAMAPGWPATPELSLHPTEFAHKPVPVTHAMPALPLLASDERTRTIPTNVVSRITTPAQRARVHAYAAKLPVNMDYIFRDAGLMSLLMSEEELGTSIDEVSALNYVDMAALKDVLLWLSCFQKEPSAFFNGDATTHHKFALHMLTVKWEGDRAVTHAQRVGYAPPPGHPINESALQGTPIPFVYDADRYQREWMYRYMVGERVLGMTQKTDVASWEAEVNHRMNVESTWLNAQGVQIKKGEPRTSGWALNPQTLGPELFARRIHAVPRLPELHTGTFGEVVWDGTRMFYTSRAPHARNWGTLEELTRFPMLLAKVDPADFARAPTLPEMLFVDRFGVTMRGVAHTQQCTRGAHEVFRRPLASTLGYEHEWASHGVTYEDYRRLLVGMIEILGRQGEAMNLSGVYELGHFFYAASEHLRARGVPVSIKYKGSYHRSAADFLWGKQVWVFRHQPLNIPLKFSKLTGYKRAYPLKNL
ncbi:hypothetical protein SEUCBS140593_006890 [Sporothrix eucalyptigena]|uniref:Uncharacterized protein n=1 Tax=Sporothrix eucalyptigena TaxID=1812306 RepID=A0ABP0CA38_9PEZI